MAGGVLGSIFNPDPRVVRGGHALGEILTGQIGTPGVYEDTLKKVYGTEEQLQQARRERSRAMTAKRMFDARSAITEELLARVFSGDPQAAAELGAAALGSNQTVNLGQLGKRQRPFYDQNVIAAQEALESGNFVDYNRFNAGALGDEYDPIKQEGNVLRPLGEGIDSEGFVMIPTPESAERIAATQARVAQGQQRTDAAVARAKRAPASRSVQKVMTEAEYKRLPSGTQYQHPDGSIRVKP